MSVPLTKIREQGTVVLTTAADRISGLRNQTRDRELPPTPPTDGVAQIASHQQFSQGLSNTQEGTHSEAIGTSRQLRRIPHVSGSLQRSLGTKNAPNLTYASGHEGQALENYERQCKTLPHRPQLNTQEQDDEVKRQRHGQEAQRRSKSASSMTLPAGRFKWNGGKHGSESKVSQSYVCNTASGPGQGNTGLLTITPPAKLAAEVELPSDVSEPAPVGPEEALTGSGDQEIRKDGIGGDNINEPRASDESLPQEEEKEPPDLDVQAPEDQLQPTLAPYMMIISDICTKIRKANEERGIETPPDFSPAEKELELFAKDLKKKTLTVTHDVLGKAQQEHANEMAKIIADQTRVFQGAEQDHERNLKYLSDEHSKSRRGLEDQISQLNHDHQVKEDKSFADMKKMAQESAQEITRLNNDVVNKKHELETAEIQHRDKLKDLEDEHVKKLEEANEEYARQLGIAKEGMRKKTRDLTHKEP
ncbi:hypothetical protein FKW77_009119 [Venturia effusa]|uniref:Uncharacterized protein n=1 Tax=Venturia effusa TaxID=50376 RepID=A0A517LBJ9_9PEZI|nr:hypothetical protein FKW77_009119 [Venturia effusa]